MSKLPTESAEQPAAPVKKKRARKSRAKSKGIVPANFSAPGPAPAKPPTSMMQKAPAVPAGDAAGPYLALIERSLTDPNITPEKLHSLLDFQERVLQREREAEFNKAYMAAKLEMPRVAKDGSVSYPVDKSKPEGEKKEAFKYTKYETLDKAIKPIERKHGLERRFTTTESTSGKLLVICHLMHTNGHFITSEIAVQYDSSGGKNNTQAAGSAFSYGKRYTTEMIWDIVKEGADDDGNAAFAAAPIDDAQFKAMQDLIDAHGIDTAKFCGHLGVESLRAIPNKMYPKAMNDLKAAVEARKKKAAKQQGEANGQG